MRFVRDKLPWKRYGSWRMSTGFLLVDSFHFLLWFIRLVSPAAWLMPFFQKETEVGVFHTHESAIEIYQLGAFLLSVTLYVISRFYHGDAYYSFTIVAVGVFVAENIQYQFRALLLRPSVDGGYMVYSHSRTYLLLLLQYFQIIFLFASAYSSAPCNSFIFAAQSGVNPLACMNSIAPIELSIITITTVGFGSIVPLPGSYEALVVAIEALLGAFLFSVMLATAISRTREVSQVGKIS